VLQAINKLNENKESEIYFNIEDEGVVRVLSQILTDILHNSLLHDDREVFYQDLLKVLEVEIYKPDWCSIEFSENS
jgi:hypothetical protein